MPDRRTARPESGFRVRGRILQKVLHDGVRAGRAAAQSAFRPEGLFYRYGMGMSARRRSCIRSLSAGCFRLRFVEVFFPFLAFLSYFYDRYAM